MAHIMSTLQRYVNDILVFSKHPMKIIEYFKVTYPLQGTGLPEYSLGGDFKAQKRDRGDTITVYAKTYISNLCQRIEELFHLSLKSCESPMASDDHPEIANSGLLNNDEHSRYIFLIGCGQWAVSLGRFDVMCTIQTMARLAAAPKQEHLNRMIRGFGYLKNHALNGIIVDTRERIISTAEGVVVNWQRTISRCNQRGTTCHACF